MQDEILDADEVARILRVNERTVRRLADKGKIVGFRVGGRWRFRRQAVDDYIRQQEQQSEKEQNGG